MDSAISPQLTGKALARARLRARRDKARRLRRRVVAFGAAAFVAVWLGLYVQLVQGKDPALSASSVQHVAAQTQSSTSSTGTGSTSTDDSSSSSLSSSTDNSSSSSGTSNSSSPSPVTTSQS
jgi:cytoskeletal protein RodZ